MSAATNHRFSVAPMMECTDRHGRYFLRQISRRALLYTEMIAAAAVVRGHRDYLLGFAPAEQPLAIQLGGADPGEMAEAAAIAEAFGYAEVNINVGCPSNRVQAGRFGACLMAEPDTIAASVTAMRAAVTIPVTVKCRIGINDRDGYDDLRRFVDPVAAAGCGSFAVHARTAVLGGLSPKQNREIPPLRYELVYRLKQDRPDLEVVINGGIGSLDEAAGHLAHVDGVMIGRAAYYTPWLLADVDRRLFGAPPALPDRHAAGEAMLPYIDDQLTAGVRLNAITRHMLGLFSGVPGARAWRRHLSSHAPRPGAGPEVVEQALNLVPRSGLQQSA